MPSYSSVLTCIGCSDRSGARDADSFSRTGVEPCSIGGSTATSLGKAKIRVATALPSVLAKRSVRAKFVTVQLTAAVEPDRGTRSRGGWDDCMMREARIWEKPTRAVQLGFKTWISLFAEHRGGCSTADALWQSQLEDLGRSSGRPLHDVEVCEGRSGDPAAWDELI